MSDDTQDDKNNIAPAPDDVGALCTSGFLKITDPDTEEVLLQQRDE